MPRKRRGQAESLEIVTRDCAGNPHQRRQAVAGTRAQGGQQGRAVPAHGRLDGPEKPDVHWRQARGRLARKDAPVAITATARELACLIYTLITRGEEYVERGIEACEQRRVDRTVQPLCRLSALRAPRRQRGGLRRSRPCLGKRRECTSCRKWHRRVGLAT